MRMGPAVLLAILLTGCNRHAQVEDAIKRMLVDPDSAKFGPFTESDDGKFACMGFNAKNRMGGYDGERQAYLKKEGEGWKILTVPPEAHDLCLKSINAPDFWGR